MRTRGQPLISTTGGPVRVCIMTMSIMVAAASAMADPITVNVRDWQDGRDWLILQGNTIQWQHFDYEVPGVWGGHNDPTWITTTLNGATILNSYAWYPTWPNGPGSGSYSSIFSGLDPILPTSGPSGFAMEVVAARNAVTVIQAPAAANGYTTIVEFNDDPPAGADYYEVNLLYNIVPEPSVSALAGLATAALMITRRRKCSGIAAIGRGFEESSN